MKRQKTPRERFDSKWSLDLGSGCWLWDRARMPYGYGLVGVGGRMKLAHRISYGLRVGEIPKGLCVLHHCDTPPCVNPDHLFLGTNQDNSDDMVSKGRAHSPCHQGESHPGAKLTESDVLQIRSSSATGRELAGKYGVSYTTIWDIKHRRSWSHV